MKTQELVTSPLELTREEKMINQDVWGAIKSLRDQGLGKKKIARTLGIDVKTVRKYLINGRWRRYQRKEERSGILGRFKDYLRKRLPQVDYCAQVLFQEIRDQGYKGSYNRVKEFVRPFREENRRLIEATVRFETGPGKQAQVDWGTTSVLIGGEMKRISVFVMVLGYSRRIYALATCNQKIRTLVDCHHHAFDHFNGRTQDILYDNPKTICLERQGETRVLNPVFEDFARYWGFRVKLCRPYRARTKGKVESGVKYVKRNFFKGKSFESLEQLNQELLRWCVEIADERIHGTTHRKPSEMFGEETLVSTQGHRVYAMEDPLRRMVAADCLVAYKTNRYSVPHRYVGHVVDLMVQKDRLKIFLKGERIAEHPLSPRKYQRLTLSGHYKGIGQPVPTAEKSAPSVPLLNPTSWPEVQVRSLQEYDRIAGGAR